MGDTVSALRPVSLTPILVVVAVLGQESVESGGNAERDEGGADHGQDESFHGRGR